MTKENLEKWADESYAGSSQSYEKFNRRASTRLTKSEREEIAQFLALQPTVTLEETARSILKFKTKFMNNFSVLLHALEHTTRILDEMHNGQFYQIF